MELRRIFDTIPNEFDTFRPRYCAQLFDKLINFCNLKQGKTVLELGPGTGQATEPILKTGCNYNAIELGKNFYNVMKAKYAHYPNFNIVNDDFITHDFGDTQFDMIYSAATIQWIDEEIAFPKTFKLLKPGGTLAMFLTKSDYKTPNPSLYAQIQKVYDKYHKPSIPYTRGSFSYTNAPLYGYENFETHEFHTTRVLNAEEYVGLCSTHCDHITIPEPYKTEFFNGLKDTVEKHDNKIVFYDTHVLHLAKKPL
ncbi:MAG: methyltransferase domain-containing protein [Clostridia bacterium]|nr:methyltransferase domain-containing protein [Clostridia bacterium]